MNSTFKKILIVLVIFTTLLQPTTYLLADTPCAPGDSECASLPPKDPGVPYTCNTGGNITLKDVILCSIDKVFNPASVLIISLAGAIFIYGLLQYITTSANQAKRDEAKKYITFGILGLIVMLTYFGLAKIVINSLFGSGVSSTAIPYPVKK